MNKAAATRLDILQKAFELIYVQGYQATSVDDILALTKVTKGAFFYHFKNKDAMGLAMIREIIHPGMYQSLVEPLLSAENPLEDLYKMMKAFLLENPVLQPKYGCPAANLVQEMAATHREFREELGILNSEWQRAIEHAIRKARSMGIVSKNVNPQQVAYFVISGYSGIRNMGKLSNSNDCYKVFLKEFKNYLGSLK